MPGTMLMGAITNIHATLKYFRNLRLYFLQIFATESGLCILLYCGKNPLGYPLLDVQSKGVLE